MHYPARVLAVSPLEQDYCALQKMFHSSFWVIEPARSLAEATEALNRHSISVVICEQDLPDGRWTDILGQCASNDHRPCVIVSSRLADDQLWSEVLHAGGFDVLAKPFEPRELFRVVNLAWRHWKEQSEQKDKYRAAIT